MLEIPNRLRFHGSPAMRPTSVLLWLPLMLYLSLLLFSPPPVQAQETTAGSDSGARVMEAFARQEKEEEGAARRISDHEKQIILFIMGSLLLVFLITTAILGITMAVYGKQVFVAHMIFAGFSVTLALAHSIVAIVWFFPF